MKQKFWKYISKADLDKKKRKIINLKYYENILKTYIKLDKKVIKFDDTEIEKYKFHQNKSPISIDNININKNVVSNEVSFGKKDFKYFVGYKDAKKLDLSAYSFQNWVHIEEILIKLNVCFYDKSWKIVRKI